MDSDVNNLTIKIIMVWAITVEGCNSAFICKRAIYCTAKWEKHVNHVSIDLIWAGVLGVNGVNSVLVYYILVIIYFFNVTFQQRDRRFCKGGHEELLQVKSFRSFFILHVF